MDALGHEVATIKIRSNFNMKIIAPCKGCEDKELYCHSTCERYLDFVKKKDEEKAMISAAKQQDNIHREFLIGQFERERKRAKNAYRHH